MTIESKLTGKNRYNKTKMKRSQPVSRGFLGDSRRRTPSCRRKTIFSASTVERDLKRSCIKRANMKTILIIAFNHATILTAPNSDEVFW